MQKAGILASLLISLLLGACVPDPEGYATDSPGVPQVTVTADTSAQDIPTLTPIAQATPSPQPTITFALFRFPPTTEPVSACAGAPATRLIIGERARVTDDDPKDLRVRERPGTNSTNTQIGRLRVGEVVIVLDGPRCADGYTWYEVETNTLRGWVAEGEIGLYYIEPFTGQ